MNSYEKWDSLDTALRRVKKDAALLFVFFASLDTIGLIGLAFVPYGDARNEAWAFFAVLIGVVPICLSPYLFYDYFHNKRDRYSIFTLLNENPVCGEKFDNAIRSAYVLGPRIAFTNEALYSLKSSYNIPFVIPADDMVWLYIRRRWYDKHPDHILSVVTKDKRVHRFPLGAKLIMSCPRKDIEPLILDPLRMAYPELFFGYTKENRTLFRDRFSEMVEGAEK
jgi:hypothetical protein